MLKFKRPHYAWFICLGGTLSIFIAFGLGGNVLSSFVPYIISERGFSNSQAGLLTTVRTVFILISLFFINRLCDRFKPRALIAAGCLMTVTAYAGMAVFETFWPCAACQVLMGFGYSCAGVVPVAAVFVRWFETNRSLAMGISSAASGVAMLVAPALTKITLGFGLKYGFLFMSLCCAVLGLIIFLLLRNTPEECSMTPYRHHAPTKETSKPEREPEQPPYTTALHNGIILLVVFLVSAPVGVGVTNVTVFLQRAGYDDMLAATAFSSIGLFMTIAKIIGAEMYDLVGGRLGNYILGSLFIAGLGLMLLAPIGSVPLLFLALLLYGFGLPLGSVSTYQWGSDLYGAEGYANAVRVFSITYNIGSLFFSAIPGILADRMGGSYMPAFIMFTAIATVSVILLQGLYHKLDIGKRPR